MNLILCWFLTLHAEWNAMHSMLTCMSLSHWPHYIALLCLRAANTYIFFMAISVHSNFCWLQYMYSFQKVAIVVSRCLHWLQSFIFLLLIKISRCRNIRTDALYHLFTSLVPIFEYCQPAHVLYMTCVNRGGLYSSLALDGSIIHINILPETNISNIYSRNIPAIRSGQVSDLWITWREYNFLLNGGKSDHLWILGNWCQCKLLSNVLLVTLHLHNIILYTCISKDS